MASVVNELFSHLVKKKTKQNKIKKGHPRVLWNIFFSKSQVDVCLLALF